MTLQTAEVVNENEHKKQLYGFTISTYASTYNNCSKWPLISLRQVLALIKRELVCL